MKKIIQFEKTELQFLKMVLNEFMMSPYTGEGSGFKPFAFNLLRKLNGKPIYTKELRNEYNKYVKKIVRKRLSQWKLTNPKRKKKK